jgi:hypothetical protein
MQESPVKAEITFDLIMTEDMPFVEGCYRLDGDEWQIFMFRHSRQGIEPVGIKRHLIWDSGVTGLNVILPDHSKINKSIVLDEMSRMLGVAEWIEVRGPDSMKLR